jgi:hypothetical protein
MIVALFLPWYTKDGQSVNAWQSMAVDDIILFVAALLAIGASAMVAARRFSSLSVATTSLVLLPALIAVIVTVYRLISPAPPVDVSLGVGAWLGLLAALGMLWGAWTGATDEGPARRNADAERRAAAEGLANAELLRLNAPLQK